MQRGFPLVVSIRLMSTSITSQNLEATLRKTHKICKFFLTLQGISFVKADLETIKQQIKKFSSLHSLSFQVETEHVIMDLNTFGNARTQNQAPLKSLEVMNRHGSLFEIKNFHS